MTIILVLIIIFCFGLIGYKLSAFYINRKKFFHSLTFLLSSLESDVVFTQDKLKNIIQKNIDNITSKELSYLCEKIYESLNNKQKIDVSLFNDMSILRKEEKDLLYSFFFQLG